MNLRPLFSAFTLTMLAVAWLGAGCGPPLRLAHSFRFGPAALSKPELDSWSSNPSLGVKALTDAAIRVPATAAEVGKVTLYLPSGYTINPAARLGTAEGYVFMATAADFYAGNLKVVNPAAYENTAQAQACAPGSHAAVWTMHFEGSSSSTEAVTVPIFIDPTSGDETTLGAYKLQACLPLAKIASPGGLPLGSRLRELGWEFTHLRNPTAKAVYVWRAFISNPDANANPDPVTTYELRSDLPLPAKLTLTARADRTHHRAVLDGRLTMSTLSVAGVPVALYRGARGYLTHTRSTTNGSFRFVRSLRKSSTYSAETWAIGACNGESTAPKGCVDETRAVIDSPVVRIVVHRRR
jgi:hypothetical protein